jgi:hypothetical protein
MSLQSRKSPTMRRSILAFTATLLGATSAMAIEEPDYEVVETTSDYEIRRYAPFIVAETEVPGDFDDAGNDAFRILAGYIFGNNKAVPETAMMTRQASQPASVKMAMTAPVLSTAPSAETSEPHVYGFVMPSKYDMDSLPIPIDARVTIRTVPERVVAVRCYSGRWSASKYEANETALLDALARDGVRTMGAPIFARYNAPIVPWFMRRNEVMIEIAPALSGTASKH